MNKLTIKNIGNSFKEFPFSTVFLCLILITTYLLMASDANRYENIPIKYLVLWGANFSGLTLGSESWRLFTSIFLHFNIKHLLLNTISLYIVGNLLERRIGFIWFLLYFILFGLSGSIVSVIENEYLVSAGSSGAIFGLIGFYFVISLKPSQKRNFRQSKNILLIIFLNLLYGFLNDTIDNAAHIGGLILGLFVGALFLIPYKSDSIKPRFYKLSGFVLSSLIICCTYLAIPKGRAEYYEFFKYLLEKEKKAILIQDQDGSLRNPNFNSDLKIANKHWQDIKDSIKKLNYIAEEGVKKDTANFRIYIDHQQKIVRYLQKISEQGSFMFLDSVEKTYQLIDELPPLYYPLNFFPKDTIIDTRKKAKIWYDQHWIKTKDSLNASYYRISRVDSLGRCQSFTSDFYADGTLQMKGNYHNNLMDGIFYYFYPHRRYSSIGIMSLSQRVGKWQFFYKNGQMKSEFMFHLDKKAEMLNFWDRNGVQTIIDGDGFCDSFNENDSIYEKGFYYKYYKDGKWDGFYADSSPYYEEVYEDGKLIDGKSYSKSGQLFSYQRITEGPQPKIGWENYYQYIDTSLAREENNLPYNKKGYSSFRCFVDTMGTIKGISPESIFGYGIESQIMKIVKEKPFFTVGKYRGQQRGMVTYLFVPINMN